VILPSFDLWILIVAIVSLHLNVRAASGQRVDNGELGIREACVIAGGTPSSTPRSPGKHQGFVQLIRGPEYVSSDAPRR